MRNFRIHHDEKNTMESEVKRIDAFREKVQGKCACAEYNNNSMFVELLCVLLERVVDF